MKEPVYTPVLPRGPIRLPLARLHAFYDVGGRPALWTEVRRLLIERVGPRARSPEEVAALRAWVDLEHEPTFAHYLRRFEGANA